MFNFTRRFRTARRLREIVNVFIRHGFGNIVDQLHLGKYVPLSKRLKSYGYWPSLLKGPNAPERLRMAFEELGPSFIKFAQLLATRPDLIPTRFAVEFERLQDRVAPFPFDEVKVIIEETFSAPFEEIFRQFERVPLAAASIAQVHKAVLIDHTDVIVKVQRPGIAEGIEDDIEILFNVARLMEAYLPDSKYLNPVGIVREFQKTVTRELDFVAEARNCERIRNNFVDVANVHIPKPFHRYSTDRVLVLERIQGIRVDDAEGIRAMGVEPKEVAGTVIDAYFKMILVDGLFHGDPHPGNMLVERDGSIGFMDFGIVGRINDETRAILTNIFTSLIKKDFDGLVDMHIMLGLVPEDMDIEAFRRDFKADLSELIEPLYGLTLNEIDFAAYANEVISLIIRHRTRVPSDMLLLDKVMLMLQSIVRKLDPEFDFMKAAGPYMSHIASETMFNPKKSIEEAFKGVMDAGLFVKHLPKQLKKVLWKVIRDEVVVKLSIKGLDNLIKDIDRSTNRLSVAMIISAILISSAIMHATEVGPTVYGMSVLGFMVFGCAAVLGIALVISIIRSGRL